MKLDDCFFFRVFWWFVFLFGFVLFFKADLSKHLKMNESDFARTEINEELDTKIWNVSKKKFYKKKKINSLNFIHKMIYLPIINSFFQYFRIDLINIIDSHMTRHLLFHFKILHSYSYSYINEITHFNRQFVTVIDHYF